MNHQRRRNNHNNNNHNRQHQRLRRARSLWDETRKPNASKKAFLQAILYELQPIRYSELQKYSSILYNITFYRSPTSIHKFMTKTVPFVLIAIVQFLLRRTLREWMYVIGFIMYWFIVAYLHHLLHAGPMIVISTILILIFTIGLGDNKTEEEGYVSAYSVFNRGFQNILGSLDADNLVAQHVGGGGGVAGLAAGHRIRDLEDDNDEFGGGGGGNAGAGRRRMQQHRNQNRAEQNQPNQNEQNQNQHQQPQQENNNNNQNRSRKSGKKARRKRNIEEKRERRREVELQREAAAALGFGGQEGVDDIVAMNRLIEEQVHDGFDGGNDNNDDDGIDENENEFDR